MKIRFDRMRILATVLILVVVASAAGLYQLGRNHVTTPTHKSNASATIAPPTNQGKVPVISSAQVKLPILMDVTSIGEKRTQSFVATQDWDMAWDYSCPSNQMGGGLTVVVNDESGAASKNNTALAKFGSKGSGIQHYHGGGTYTLGIDSVCNWHVTVKEPAI